jgi:hypothetical protein
VARDSAVYFFPSRANTPFTAPVIIRFTAEMETPPGSSVGIVAKPIADARITRENLLRTATPPCSMVPQHLVAVAALAGSSIESMWMYSLSLMRLRRSAARTRPAARRRSDATCSIRE